MGDKTEDDPFLQEFLARAQRRQAKLAEIEKPEVIEDRQDVSYPALSPLPEEDDNDENETLPGTRHRDELSITDDKNAVASSDESDLDYSADLSLSPTCDTPNEVYRAELVHCNSSPDIQQQDDNNQTYSHPVSPRKQAPIVTQYHPQESLAPLQELQPEQKPTSSQSLPGTSSNEQLIKDLELKVDRAEKARSQLKRCVEYSKYGSKEHVEAARILTVTELEHLNYTNQMAKFKEGIRKESESLGSIEISNIELRISSKLRSDLADAGVSHYFFCVATCGMEVKSSEIINTEDIRRQDLKSYLQFKDKITFADLPPKFIVKVEVFELVIGQQFPKLLSRLTPSKKSKITPESYFKRVGSMKLTIDDRDTKYKNLTQWTKNEESKYIERECKFEVKLAPEQLPTKAGMLSVKCINSEGRPDWSRFWVNLSGGKLCFWKSKQNFIDGMGANQKLEFKNICSQQVQKLTPDDDLYRQNSFVVYSLEELVGGERENLLQRVLKEDNKLKIVKHQLVAENKDDRDSWCTVLDRSMHCFREWHGKTKTYSLEELREMFSKSY